MSQVEQHRGGTKEPSVRIVKGAAESHAFASKLVTPDVLGRVWKINVNQALVLIPKTPVHLVAFAAARV
jgi:hypothetical protein